MKWELAANRVKRAEERFALAHIELEDAIARLRRRVRLPQESGVIWIFAEHGILDELEMRVELEDCPSCDDDGANVPSPAAKAAHWAVILEVCRYERGDLFELPTSQELENLARDAYHAEPGGTVAFPLVALGENLDRDWRAFIAMQNIDAQRIAAVFGVDPRLLVGGATFTRSIADDEEWCCRTFNLR